MGCPAQACGFPNHHRLPTRPASPTRRRPQLGPRMPRRTVREPAQQPLQQSLWTPPKTRAGRPCPAHHRHIPPVVDRITGTSPASPGVADFQSRSEERQLPRQVRQCLGPVVTGALRCPRPTRSCRSSLSRAGTPSRNGCRCVADQGARLVHTYALAGAPAPRQKRTFAREPSSRA